MFTLISICETSNSSLRMVWASCEGEPGVTSWLELSSGLSMQYLSSLHSHWINFVVNSETCKTHLGTYFSDNYLLLNNDLPSCLSSTYSKPERFARRMGAYMRAVTWVTRIKYIKPLEANRLNYRNEEL